MYFYVPEFQRNYEWRTSTSSTAKDKQVDELFEDIYSAYENNDDNYFLGTLITFYQEEVNDDRFGKYYVIDGQQRLTTLAILIRSYIKKLEKLKEEEEKRKYWDEQKKFKKKQLCSLWFKYVKIRLLFLIMPFMELKDASLRALFTSSLVTDLEDSKTKSTAETLGVGTLIAIPVNLPFISG